MTESKHVFICYASEDKKTVIRPLVEALKANGFTYWLDDNEIKWGDPVRKKLLNGMSTSAFVIVVLSSGSIEKQWPKWERDAALEMEISSGKIRVLPLVVGNEIERDSLFAKEPLLGLKRYLTWSGESSATVAVEALREWITSTNPIPESRIIDRDCVRNSKWLLPGEVFVIELLEDPVELKRDGDKINIRVDRRNVKKCIIDNEGRRKLITDRVAAFPDVINMLDAEDLRVQRFLTRVSKGNEDSVLDPRKLKVPLRWASGGVLSLVKFKDKEWVPLFFRDIPPYGWNISLGSTERRFDQNTLAQRDDEWEHRTPWDFISREFMEESMVVNARPESELVNGKLSFRRFKPVVPFPGLSKERWEKYARFRAKCDGWDFEKDDTMIELKPVGLNLPMNLEILSNPRASDDRGSSDEDDVLVCFSLRDLGIEVVKVFRYELQDGDCLLDGEIDHEGCLVRMPMALFSCNYLRTIFSRNEDWYRYVTPFTPEEAPSIEVKHAPKESDVVSFLWDASQRMKIIHGEMEATDHEKERFRKWYDMFGSNFVDEHGRPSLAKPSRLFVPGTAKILNLFFSQLSS